jgi:ParB/RepB/Spo0J family partition protein
VTESNFRRIPVQQLEISEKNARKSQLSDDDLDGLAGTIVSVGLMHPLIVRETGEGSGKYEVVAGGRRFLAAQKAGEKDVDCKIIPPSTSSTQLQVMSLVENIQRSDLSIDDRADCIKVIIALYDGDLPTVSRKLGYPQKVLQDWVDAASVIRLVKNKATLKDTPILGMIARDIPEANQDVTFQLTQGIEKDLARRIIRGIRDNPIEDPRKIAERIKGEAKDTTVNIYVRGDLHEALLKAVEKHTPRISKKAYIVDALEKRLKEEGFY